jgi:hypothetical protein
MNEVREAIERVGAPFDSAVSIDDLTRRRDRVRTRKRFTAGGLALMIAAGGSLVAARAFLASSPESFPKIRVAATGQAVGTAATRAATICPTPSGDSPPPVVLSSTSGSVGSSIGVTGAFQTRFVFLQLWWNADEKKIPAHVAAPPWPPTGPDLRFEPAISGPMMELAAIGGPGSNDDCSFQTQFTVPDVDPGTYNVLMAFGSVEQRGYALFTAALAFEVTE